MGARVCRSNIRTQARFGPRHRRHRYRNRSQCNRCRRRRCRCCHHSHHRYARDRIRRLRCRICRRLRIPRRDALNIAVCVYASFSKCRCASMLVGCGWLIIILSLYDTNTTNFAVSGRFFSTLCFCTRLTSYDSRPNSISLHSTSVFYNYYHITPLFCAMYVYVHVLVLLVSQPCYCHHLVHPIRTVCYPYYHCLCSDTYMLPIIAIFGLCALQVLLDARTAVRRAWAIVFLWRRDERQRTEEPQIARLITTRTRL